MTVNPAPADPWTCPFCPLACDHLGVSASAAGLVLVGAECERAQRALAAFGMAPAASPSVDGRPASADEAVRAAAVLLGKSRLPLFAGLGTDVAGARALYPLACATGAIADAAGGDAFFEGLRALQDRGQFTTTIAEIRTRADLLVFVGPAPLAQAPLLADRLGIGDPQGPSREIVAMEELDAGGDLFDALAWLGALLGPREIAAAPRALRTLAERLQRARYAVFVGAPGLLPAHGALVIEAVHRIVGQLNRRTRAAALWVGGGNGAATANQVFAWLSGLPLRTRAGPRGLEHEPRCFGSERLIADRAVDALLWVSSFDAEAAPPATSLPLVALVHPARAAACARPGAVVIPVATPGIGSDGHVFRTDGTVLMPLAALRDDGLPTVADLATRILGALKARSS